MADDYYNGPPSDEETEGPLPFEHLFAPLVLDARERLRQQIDASSIALLQAKAHLGWERYLLKRFCWAGAKAAQFQFQIFKTVRSVFSCAATVTPKPPDRLYRAFIGLSPKERLHKLFGEFPVLAEYCEVIVGHWIATVSEFLNRLEADRTSLDAHIVGGPFTRPPVGLQAGLSDPHNGGRCVVRLTFERGASLIYKPRSIAAEAHFSDLLREFDTEKIPYAFRSAQCWVRDEYGWMEDVKPRPCDTLAEVHAFYWRAGAQLALVYLARGVDMHRDNLIAAGEFPMLIDLEALWHPQEHTGAGNSPIASTVLRTGFLPQNNPHLGALYRWNALSHRLDSNFAAMNWTSVNDDNMTLERASRSFRNAHHLPVFAGTECLARDFLPDILAGFCWIGKKVFEDHQEREKFQKWIQMLTQCSRRRILRSSQWYQTAIEQLTVPSALRRNGIAGADFTHLAHSGIPVSEAEWVALKQLEIPWFEQETSTQHDQDGSLPVGTMEEFMAQRSLIIDALATPANRDRHSPVNQ